MDKSTTLSVHRCRFVDYAPSAVTALAFPPLPLPSVKGKQKSSALKKFGLLAVGHANGNIDLCKWMGGEGEVQCSQAWVTQKTLSGPYPSKVDSLAFVIRHPDEINEHEVPNLSDLRLFSSGGGSELVEWDLERSCIKRTISSQGGSIWSVAANPSGTTLALGCEDGTVRLLSVANGTLAHLRRFDRVKCRMLSLAWGPPVPLQRKPRTEVADSDESDDDDDEWTDSWLVTGGSDSSLRKWDVSTGRVLERMMTDKARGDRTLVWTVGVLGDGTIVSGDSLGMVKFWDSRTCTQLHSFQAHGADVLCMAISPEGKVVYTAGVDQKTVQFSLVKTSSTISNNTFSMQWTQTTSRRMHSHDVRALSIWPPYTPLPPSYRRQFPIDVAPILASGGLDMSVVLTPAALPTSTVVKIINPLNTSTDATFEDSYHRKLSYIPQGTVRVAKSARLVSCAGEANLSVWGIHRKSEERPGDDDPSMAQDGEIEPTLQEVDPEPSAGGWEKVLEMDLVVHSNIVAHEISNDGRWLVVSDLYETKLFALRSSKSHQFTVKRVKEFSSILQAHIPTSTSHPHSTGVRALSFSPDSSRLIISTCFTSSVLVIDLTSDRPSVLRRFDHHRSQDVALHGKTIKSLSSKKPAQVNGSKDVEMADVNGVDSSVESDGREDNEDSDDEGGESVSPSPTIVSVDRIAISADGQWLATSDDHSRTHIFNLDSISYHTTLPSFHHRAQTLVFDPSRPSILLLAFPNNTIQIYDVELRQFPTWGKELATSLPRRITESHEPILGVSFDPPASGLDAATAAGDPHSKYLLFWSSTWLFKIGLDTSTRTGGKKRRREQGGPAAAVPGLVEDGADEKQWRDFKMITQYRPIACCQFLGRDELVIVERPLVDVLAMLPPAYFKHRYGTT